MRALLHNGPESFHQARAATGWDDERRGHYSDTGSRVPQREARRDPYEQRDETEYYRGATSMDELDRGKDRCPQRRHENERRNVRWNRDESMDVPSSSDDSLEEWGARRGTIRADGRYGPDRRLSKPNEQNVAYRGRSDGYGQRSTHYASDEGPHARDELAKRGREKGTHRSQQGHAQSENDGDFGPEWDYGYNERNQGSQEMYGRETRGPKPEHRGVTLPSHMDWTQSAAMSQMFRPMEPDVRELDPYNGTGDFEKFMRRFERTLKLKDITDPRRKLVLLRGKLKGSALSALEVQEDYQPETMDNYGNVIEFLNERFVIPMDISYRIEKLQKVVQEGPLREYIDLLFQRWVQYIDPLTIPSEDKEKLLADAFLKGLKPWLRQRLETGYPETFEQLKKRALRIMMSNEEKDQQTRQPNQQGNEQHQKSKFQNSRDQGAKRHNDRPPPATDSNKTPLGPSSGQKTQSSLLEGGSCDICHRTNHVTADCRIGKSACYGCGEEGHRAFECPKRRNKGTTDDRDCYGCGEKHLERLPKKEPKQSAGLERK